jgi:hypothetical protein
MTKLVRILTLYIAVTMIGDIGGRLYDGFGFNGSLYLRVLVFTFCDIEIYLRLVNKFFFFLYIALFESLSTL